MVRQVTLVQSKSEVLMVLEHENYENMDPNVAPQGTQVIRRS